MAGPPALAAAACAVADTGAVADTDAGPSAGEQQPLLRLHHFAQHLRVDQMIALAVRRAALPA